MFNVSIKYIYVGTALFVWLIISCCELPTVLMFPTAVADVHFELPSDGILSCLLHSVL